MLAGIEAASLTSLTGKEEANAVLSRVEGAAGKAGTAAPGGPQPLRLLYVTPERVVNSKRLLGKLEKRHKAGGLARIAIDEAHCELTRPQSRCAHMSRCKAATSAAYLGQWNSLGRSAPLLLTRGATRYRRLRGCALLTRPLCEQQPTVRGHA